MEGRLTSAHLLGNHDNTRRPGSVPDPGHGEELDEAGDHVSGDLEPGLPDEDRLLLQEAVDVVDVPSGLDGRVPEAQQRLPGVEVAILLDVPAGALRAEPRATHERHGRDEGGPDL